MNRTAPARVFACGRPGHPLRRAKASAALEADLLGRLERYQSEKKLNRSRTRARILQTVLQLGEHFTGPELVRRVRKAHPDIGAATVYRAVPVLLGAGVLRESLTDGTGQSVYEVQHSGHHDHVVCLDCKAILEFHEVGIESLQEKVLERLGFSQVHHSHVIYAHCQYKKKNP